MVPLAVYWATWVKLLIVVSELLFVESSVLSVDYLARRYIMNRLYKVDDIDRNLSVARFRPLDVLVGGMGLVSPLLLTHWLRKKLQKLEEHVS